MASAYVCNVVIDLEFTPVPKCLQKGTGLRQEIIEIGAVKLDSKGNVVGEFSHTVRPTLAKGISGTVRNLTGIVNSEIACARILPDVLEALAAWIGPGRVRMVTWSDSDLKQIRAECAAKGIKQHLPSRWIDIQRFYSYFMDLGKRKVALGEAADWLGIANNKNLAHRALYDAQVTAEIFRMMAAGECAEHRERVRAEVRNARDAAACSASIASRCGGLADLMVSLAAKEARVAA